MLLLSFDSGNDRSTLAGLRTSYIQNKRIGILHSENIKFYILHTPHMPVILGLTWHHRHNPHVSRKEGQITRWNNLLP